jgi:hypothetical protein
MKISMASLALAMLAEVAIAKNCKGGLNYCGFTLLAIGEVPPWIDTPDALADFP